MGRASAWLARAGDAFAAGRFEESTSLAYKALGQITDAHERALDYKRQVMAKKAAETTELLARLETALRQLPAGLSPEQQALRAEADKNLRLSRQFYEEGGWGFAQMHAYIGLKQAKAIAPGGTVCAARIGPGD